MSQCQKSCQSGYLKDLFNCDMCECRDECPPFVCRIVCPMNVGFAQSETGCPLCQCATSLTETLASNASCEVGGRSLHFFLLFHYSFDHN